VKNKPTFPTALSVPEGPVVTLHQALVDRAIAQSRLSPRRRIILPLHKSDEATLHRMFNVAQPGTYVRPHWHRHPPKDEGLVILQGKIAIFIFDDDGTVREIVVLAAGSPTFGIDLVAGVCHSFVVLESDSVVYEVKPGPYIKATDKDFAAWAPGEGDPEVDDYLVYLHSHLKG
jgi:cupin fold WbuC family metalloprotein